MTNLDSVLKSKDITLLTKVHISQGYGLSSTHVWMRELGHKESSNYRTIALILHTSKVMLKILQARFQQYVNYELPDVQAGFRKGRGTRDQIANIHWNMEKVREFQKNIYFCFMPKTLTV